MNFDQLIEYNLRNIVLKKSHKRCSEEASPWPFPEKRKLSSSLNQQSETLYNLFSLYDQVEAYQIY